VFASIALVVTFFLKDLPITATEVALSPEQVAQADALDQALVPQREP
jgi:hypothetical protein